MKKIPLTHGQYALVDDEDFESLSQFKWYACWYKQTRQFRAVRSRRVNGKGQIILMHRQISGFPDCYVDHVNGNSLDNRRSNLRPCTAAQNQCNRTRAANNLSGFKGVDRFQDKWRAKIALNAKTYHLGLYSSPIEAACAYDGAARVLHGRFARTNF